MPKVPTSILNILKEVPESQLHTVCSKLKITETIEYKSFIAKNAQCSKPCTQFLEAQLTSGNTSTLGKIYHSIEGFLFVGGCAPGIGIAFNLIDACFCFALGNYFGCFVAIISCFPIPGFKVAEKGLEKILVELLKYISPSKLLNCFNKELNKRLANCLGIGFAENVGTHTKYLGIIRERLEEMIVGLNNPFATEIIRALGEVIKKMPKRTSKIQNGINNSKFGSLGIATKGVEGYKIL